MTNEEILKYENVPPSVAAKFLNVSAQYIRVGLQRNRLPFGSAVQVSGKDDGKWCYQISPMALINWKEGKSLQDWICENKVYLKTLLEE